MTSRFLVTGGAGFIGSNISTSLRDVTILDDFSGQNLSSEEYLVSRDIKVISGDINDSKKLKEALSGVETVYHQAAIASVPYSIKNPLKTDFVNAQGTLMLLKECVDSGVKNFVCASSSAIYGNSEQNPKTEDLRPNPQSPYAVSKLACEHYSRVFSELYGLKTASLRYFNVYGSGQKAASDYAAVIPKFIELALSDKPLVIYGDGMQTRDFVFIEDVVDANKKATGKVGVYNVGSGNAITINKLAETIVDITGSKSQVVHKDARPGEVFHSLADISKAQKELDWTPKHNLHSGLKEYIKYYTLKNPR